MSYRNYHARYADYKKLWNLKRYCSYGFEKIENYGKALEDNFNGWCIHHRLEFTLNGDFAHTSKDLKRIGMYYGRPYFELIFMKVSDHRALHNEDAHKRGTLFKGTTGHTGHKHTTESKRKMSESHRKNKTVGGKNVS
jgi:hypothetical protein